MTDKRKCPACKRMTRYIAPNALRCGHCLDEITRTRGYEHTLSCLTPKQREAYFADIARVFQPSQDGK